MVDCDYDASKQCKNCLGKSRVIMDDITGDLVCTGCGRVLDERCFDVGGEWRNFKTDGVGSGKDIGGGRERGDFRSGYNVLLDEFEANTSISGSTNAANGLQKALTAVQRLADNHAPKSGIMVAPREGEDNSQDKSIKTITARARQIVERMCLAENVTQKCMALLQKLVEKGQIIKKRDSPWVCALVHLASREENVTQTIREIAEANAVKKSNAQSMSSRQTGVIKDYGFEKKDHAADRLESNIETHVNALTKILGLGKQKAYAEDEGLMNRLVQQLGLPLPLAKHATHIVQQVYRHAAIIGKGINKLSQNSLIAVSILIVALLMDAEPKPSFGRVAVLARATEANVKFAYKLIHPKLRYLLPKDMKFRLKGGVDGLPTPATA